MMNLSMVSTRLTGFKPLVFNIPRSESLVLCPIANPVSVRYFGRLGKAPSLLVRVVMPQAFGKSPASSSKQRLFFGSLIVSHFDEFFLVALNECDGGLPVPL